MATATRFIRQLYGAKRPLAQIDNSLAVDGRPPRGMMPA
jgi:hypothetical protein